MTPRPKQGTEAAVKRRAAKPDLSRLTDEQRAWLELVVIFGEAAWGERWHTPMAQALSEVRGRPMSPMQVLSWTAGRRPVPEQVRSELKTIAGRIAEHLQRRTDVIRGWPGGSSGWA
jgi:hypothetical protein